MIRKLKIKYIVLALSSLLVLLSFIVAGMNILNYNEVVKEADTILSVLPQSRGGDLLPGAENLELDKPLPPGMSPEIPFESRFFSVSINQNGEITATDTSRIYAVDNEIAAQYAESAMKKSGNSGFVGDFRYIRVTENGGTRITFLDCGRKLALFRNFATFSVGISLSGYAVIAVLVCFFA